MSADLETTSQERLDRALVEAIQSLGTARNIERLASLLKDGANVDCRIDGATPLHWSVRASNPKAMDLLISAGANSQVLSDRGVPPLVEAWTLNTPMATSMAQTLSALPIRPTLKSERGEDWIHWAVIHQRLDEIPGFVRAGCGLNGKNSEGLTPLDVAADRGDQVAVLKLLDAGAKVGPGDNSSGLFERCSSVSMRNAAIALIRAGIDPNGRDKSGGSHLRSAMDSGSDEIVIELLEAGADPNAPTVTKKGSSNGRSPLSYASKTPGDGTGKVDFLVRILIAFGAEDGSVRQGPRMLDQVQASAGAGLTKRLLSLIESKYSGWESPSPEKLSELADLAAMYRQDDTDAAIRAYAARVAIDKAMDGTCGSLAVQRASA